MKEIKIVIDPSENCTTSGLMQRYAKQNPGVAFTRSYFSEPQLIIDGNTYRYHHWGITANNGQCVVSLFLCQIHVAGKVPSV